MPAMAQRVSYLQPVQTGALLNKLAAFAPLTNAEASALESCEGAVRRFGRRKTVRRQGEVTSDLMVLRSGWAFSFAIMPDGGRQILDLHFPGDIIGLPSIAFDKSVSGIGTITQVELCPLPRARFAEVSGISATLSTLLNAMAMVENVILIDRLKAIGRMEARDRLAHFLLQILARLEVSEPSARDSFHMPMSQELIGDALGLSAIHTNRTMRRLEKEGHLLRDHQQITLLDRTKLSESVDFTNRYDQFTTTWFPE